MSLARCGAAALLLFGYPWIMVAAEEQSDPDAIAIVDRVNARDEGEVLTRSIHFLLEDKRGKQRLQETKAFRKTYDGEKKSAIFYLEPKNISGTAFLSFDFLDAAKEDAQWLYLPAMRRVRRISAANRGDYYLGTDFTYDDMKHESDLALEDYIWKSAGQEEVDGNLCEILAVTPRSADLVEELGYSRGRTWIDTENAMKRKAQFWDEGGNELKTIFFNDIRQVDGIWTAHELVAENHKTGHKTTLRMSDIDYSTPIDDDLFSDRALQRGL